MDNRGLACADRSSQYHKALPPHDGFEDRGQCSRVRLSEMEEPGVRGQSEGFFTKVEETRVHISLVNSGFQEIAYTRECHSVGFGCN